MIKLVFWSIQIGNSIWYPNWCPLLLIDPVVQVTNRNSKTYWLIAICLKEVYSPGYHVVFKVTEVKVCNREIGKDTNSNL